MEVAGIEPACNTSLQTSLRAQFILHFLREDPKRTKYLAPIPCLPVGQIRRYGWEIAAASPKLFRPSLSDRTQKERTASDYLGQRKSHPVYRSKRRTDSVSRCIRMCFLPGRFASVWASSARISERHSIVHTGHSLFKVLSTSRMASRFFRISRLSYFFFPLTSAIPSFSRLPLL